MCRSAEPGICLGKMEELVALCPADAGITSTGEEDREPKLINVITLTLQYCHSLVDINLSPD